MTTVEDRERAIINEAAEVRDVYRLAGKHEVVRLFQEDYDFLEKRGKINSLEQLPNYIEVARGQRKRKKRRRRPPESMFND